MVFNIAGTLGAIILATVLGWTMTDERLRFATVGIVLGLISIIPPWIVFRTARERPRAGEQQAISLRAAFSATVSNRPFQLVMGLYLLSWTTASILSAVLVYYANYYFRVPEQANYFVLVAQSAAIAFIPLCVAISRRLDKRRAFMVGTLWWIGTLLAIFALRPDQVIWAYALAALSGFGIATAYVVPWSMLPDIVEHDAIQTGQRREGSFYAFASFFQKLGTGAALWAMGQALAATGYLKPVPGEPLPVQPTEAVEAIRLFVGPVPVALLATSIVFAWFYPITRRVHHALVNELAARRS
jgi:GPH family glycoside/pentoside/hexuronide:cation symporter